MGTRAQEAERRRTMCDPCWNNQHEKCAGGACKCKNPKHGRAKDVEPVGAKKYVCITKDGKRHDIEAENARQANLIAERRFGYDNISVPPQESLRAKDAQPDPHEDKRWKQHMHQDGLWCGDVNCKTCAKSGAMAKGVKEMKRAKDAEVKPVSDAVCPLCKYPMSGSKCDNPGCEASGNVPPVIIERRKKEAAEQAERARTNKLRNASYAKDAEVKPVKYNGEAVQKEINKDKRIGGKEAKAIHALLKGRARDASPFDVDTDTGAERVVRREAKAGLSAQQIAKKYGFSLSFVKEVLDEVKPVGDAKFTGSYEAWMKAVKAKGADRFTSSGNVQSAYKGRILIGVWDAYGSASIAKDDVQPVGDAKYSILKSDYMAAQSSGPRKPWFVKDGSVLIGGAAFATEEAAKKYVAYLEKSDRENAPRERREARQIKPAYTTLAEMQRAKEDPDSAYSLYAEGRISKRLYEEASKKLRYR